MNNAAIVEAFALEGMQAEDYGNTVVIYFGHEEVRLSEFGNSIQIHVKNSGGKHPLIIEGNEGVIKTLAPKKNAEDMAWIEPGQLVTITRGKKKISFVPTAG